jgi:hypothetical protein
MIRDPPVAMTGSDSVFVMNLLIGPNLHERGHNDQSDRERAKTAPRAPPTAGNSHRRPISDTKKIERGPTERAPM